MRATVGSVERTGKNVIYTLVIKRKRRGYRTNIPVSETSGGHFVRLDWARSQIKLPVCAGRHTNIVPLAPAYRYQIVLKWSVPGGRDVFKQRPESFGAQITESEKRRFIITKRGRVLVTPEFKRLKRSFSSVQLKSARASRSCCARAAAAKRKWYSILHYGSRSTVKMMNGFREDGSLFKPR